MYRTQITESSRLDNTSEMTTTKPEGDDPSSESPRLVQLKKLPTLDEVPTDALEDPLQKMLGKAIAIQLKAMKKDKFVSQFAFEYLVLLVEEYLSDMLKALHKMANIQRRHCISKNDLLPILEGYDVQYCDLMVEFERSQYVKSLFSDELRNISETSELVKEKEQTQLTDKELLDSSHSEFFVKDLEILNLVPPSNKNNKYVPKWLPEFPPDHTYRFTSQYNQPITDERQMKRKLVEEANLSERALVRLMNEGYEDEKPKINSSKSMFEESQQETLLIYGLPKEKKAKTVDNVQELLRTLPLRNFNVEEYARNRVDIARRKVLEYERRQLQLQKDPFIKASHFASPFSKTSTNTKQVEKELKGLLQRSYVGLVKSVPLLRERRAHEVELAKEAKRLREEQIRQEKQNQRGAEYDVLDLSNLNGDPFFDGLGSSDSEDEPIENNVVMQDSSSLTAEPMEIISTVDENSMQINDHQPSLENSQPPEYPVKESPVILPNVESPSNETGNSTS